jgi:hypothetical protein
MGGCREGGTAGMKGRKWQAKRRERKKKRRTSDTDRNPRRSTNEPRTLREAGERGTYTEVGEDGIEAGEREPILWELRWAALESFGRRTEFETTWRRSASAMGETGDIGEGVRRTEDRVIRQTHTLDGRRRGHDGGREFAVTADGVDGE